MQVRALPEGARIGRMVVGLTHAGIAEESNRQRLRDLWIEHGLLVFRDGQCDADFQVELSHCFGALQVHSVKEMLHPEREELLVVKGGSGGILEVNGARLGGYIPWHSDQVFTVETNHGGILRVAQMPEKGGNTAFVDQIEAYEALSPGVRGRIEGLAVVYRMQAGTIPNFRFLPSQAIRLIRPNPFQDRLDARIAAGDYPPVVHPLVFAQPETGRKVLNLSPMFVDHVLGMSAQESEALLWALAEHVTDESRVYDHVWQPDDMLLWDNWRMIHCARGVPEGAYREVHRTSIAGDYALGRLLVPAV